MLLVLCVGDVVAAVAPDELATPLDGNLADGIEADEGTEEDEADAELLDIGVGPGIVGSISGHQRAQYSAMIDKEKKNGEGGDDDGERIEARP